jgi:hypothetical protein
MVFRDFFDSQSGLDAVLLSALEGVDPISLNNEIVQFSDVVKNLGLYLLIIFFLGGTS